MTRAITLRILSVFTFSIFSFFAMAQMPGARTGGQNMNVGHIYGKIVDNNNKPVEAASIQLTQTKMDTATKKKKDFTIAILLSDKRGEFLIDQLPVIFLR